MSIKLETQINSGDIVGGTAPFVQDSIAIWDPVTGPRILQDCDLVISSAGNNLDHKTSGGTLTIGATNASTITIGAKAGSVITIGGSGSTINLVGSTTYEQVTNLQISDKLITLNKGAGAASATATGFEIEENSLITGYFKTSADRNSYSLLAPNSVGIVTITPGASGFTLDDTVVKTTSTTVTDNTLVRFDLTTGRLIQSTGITVADTTNNVTGMGTLSCGAITTTTVNMTDTSFVLDSDEGSGYKLTLQKDGTQAAAVTLTFPKVTDTLCGIAASQALTNKTIDADSNTLSNIVNANIKSTAAIDRSKLAAGTADHVVINAPSTGVFSSEAQLAAARGGLATNASAWATGLVHVTNGTPSTFSTSLLVNADVAASGVANIDWNKLAAGTANYPMITSASGYPTTEQYLDRTRGGTGITSTATFPASGTVATGTGTTNVLPKFTTGTSGIIGDSTVTDNGTTLATTLKAFQLGDGSTTGDRTITVNRGGTNPALKWNETTDKWQFSNDGTNYSDMGSGGASGINYIDNGDAELNATTGWATYADAAGTSPVNGTGGSPTVTWTVNSTNPLRGTYDFVFTKDAANRQGEGSSYDFTIDNTDLASMLTISGDATTSANYVDGDVRFYIYDVTNSVVIEPSSVELLAGSYGSFKCEFQTAIDSTSYRLCVHVASTNANAYTINFDNISVGPNTLIYGNIQDRQYDLTVTGTNWTTARAVGVPYKTRDGIWRLKFNINGALTTATLTSYTLTITGVTFKTGFAQAVSAFNQNNAAACTARVTAATNTVVVYHASTSIDAYYISGDVELDSQPTFATDFYPVQLSDGNDGRTVAFNTTGVCTGTLTTSYNVAKWAAVETDTHAAYSPTTGLYTIPVSNYYDISSAILLTSGGNAGQYMIVGIYKNGTIYRYSIGYLTVNTGDTRVQCDINGVKLVKGDTIGIYVYTNIGTPAYSTAGNWFSISKSGGSATISASEKIIALYETNAGQTFTDGSGFEIVNFEDKILDTHNAVTVGASWKFTAPISKSYKLDFDIMFTSNSWDAGDSREIRVYKNGVAFYDVYEAVEATISTNIHLGGGTVVNLNKGDYIDIRLDIGGETTTLDTGAMSNRISIYSIN